ncbi:MAG: SMP-30/gluconolactonase/LRE family protein [Pseudomonadota bacterium]
MNLDDLENVGVGLRRPECVLCSADGSVYVSDWDGGVCRIAPDGGQHRILARESPVEIRPNGIALQPDGSFLLANLADAGGVWRLFGGGRVDPFVVEVDGAPLPPTNFVLPDRAGRTWITISTRIRPRADAFRPWASDGFIVLHDKSGTRIVADGLGYTNEVQLHPSGEWLYVNETFARRTSRLKIATDGSLGSRETVTEYGTGTYPDGLCFDEEGGFWIASIVSNRIIRVGPDRAHTVILEDSDKEHLELVETAFQDGRMGSVHLKHIVSQRLRSTSSIAFGGAERRLCYLGCLLDDRIVRWASPVAGVEPVHWSWPVL